jgi:hypothetical protein
LLLQQLLRKLHVVLDVTKGAGVDSNLSRRRIWFQPQKRPTPPYAQADGQKGTKTPRAAHHHVHGSLRHDGGQTTH